MRRRHPKVTVTFTPGPRQTAGHGDHREVQALARSRA